MPWLRRLLHPRGAAVLMPELGRASRDTVFVSGHRLRGPVPVLHEHVRHARHPRPCTRRSRPGSRSREPDLDVWVISGDGDALSIGGNHLIHALRRNIDLKILPVQQPDLRADRRASTHRRPRSARSRSRRRSARSIIRSTRCRSRWVPRRRSSAHARHGPPAHARHVPPRARPQGHRVRGDLPELQRLQRWCVRADHQQRGPAPTCSSRCSTGSPCASGPITSSASPSTTRAIPASRWLPTSVKRQCSCTTSRVKIRASRSCCRGWRRSARAHAHRRLPGGGPTRVRRGDLTATRGRGRGERPR